VSEQANVRTVQRVYDSVAKADVESLLEALHADVEWRVPAMSGVSFAGARRGRDQVGAFFGELARVQDIVEFQPERFIAQGDTVVVLGRFVMRVKSTGRNSASEWAHAWRLADGKVTHFQEYVDTAAVIRAHTG
jgi:ketosteroid isomerase-like protein